MGQERINYSVGVRTCLCCGIPKDFKEFTMVVRKAGFVAPHAECKQCRSEKIAQIAAENRASLRPWAYKQCINEECNKIFYRTKDACPSCGAIGENYGQ